MSFWLLALCGKCYRWAEHKGKQRPASKFLQYRPVERYSACPRQEVATCRAVYRFACCFGNRKNCACCERQSVNQLEKGSAQQGSPPCRHPKGAVSNHGQSGECMGKLRRMEKDSWVCQQLLFVCAKFLASFCHRRGCTRLRRQRSQTCFI